MVWMIFDAVASRQHDDRDSYALRTERRQNIQPVASGQGEVEQHQVEGFSGGAIEGG